MTLVCGEWEEERYPPTRTGPGGFNENLLWAVEFSGNLPTPPRAVSAASSSWQTLPIVAIVSGQFGLKVENREHERWAWVLKIL
jgi:hypothetical protein